MIEAGVKETGECEQAKKKKKDKIRTCVVQMMTFISRQDFEIIMMTMFKEIKTKLDNSPRS